MDTLAVHRVKKIKWQVIDLSKENMNLFAMDLTIIKIDNTETVITLFSDDKSNLLLIPLPEKTKRSDVNGKLSKN